MLVSYRPRVLVLLFVNSSTDLKDATLTIRSLIAQTCSFWNLALIGESGEFSEQTDPRIHVLTKADRLVFGASSFVMKLEPGDQLARNALDEILAVWKKTPSLAAVYTDHDSFHEEGHERFNPIFKPDWSPYLLRSQNYIDRSIAVRCDVLDSYDEYFDWRDPVTLYRICLELSRRALEVGHIPEVLFHLRPVVSSSGCRKAALQKNLARECMPASVLETDDQDVFAVQYGLRGRPKVSILIPNKDQTEVLSKCIQSLLDRTTYDNYEIILLENNSTTADIEEYYRTITQQQDNIRVVRWLSTFNFAAINNFGVQHAHGDIIVFLNNDTEIISPSWLEDMLGYIQRRDVGIVGGKLYYDDDTIQHAGVVLGMRGLAAHVNKGAQRGASGYMKKLISIHEVSIVTGACMMIEKNMFNSIGEFDEQLAVAFNDVDLCMKVRKAGKQVIFHPLVELYHYESKTRLPDTNPERAVGFAREVRYFQHKWQKELAAGDPYYNPNLSLVDESVRLR